MERRLNLFDSTMIVVGNIIGAGIFTTSGFVASHVENPYYFLLVWVIGGFLALAGALTFAELGAALPHAGGDYVYLRKAYSPIWGFLTGWTSFFVTFSGSIAALAIAFSEYISVLAPNISFQREILPNLGINLNQIIAILTILILTVFNYIGISCGKLVQNILTILKISLIVGLILLGFSIGDGKLEHFIASSQQSNLPLISQSIALALIPVFFAYSGWNASTYIAGEIKNPGRNLPLSIIIGTFFVIIVYVLINCVFIYALPVSKMSGVIKIADLAATSLFGNKVSVFLSIIVAISILGALNSMVLIGPRIYYAMAKDGVFFKRAVRVHSRFKTPYISVVLQSLWAIVLILSGTFEQLLTYVTFSILLFSSLTGISVLVIRKRFRDLNRPFKVWGYPFIPLLYVLICGWIMWNVLKGSSKEALLGLVLVSIGIPVYLYWKRRKNI